MRKALESNCGRRFLYRKTCESTDQSCDNSFFRPPGDHRKISRCLAHRCQFLLVEVRARVATCCRPSLAVEGVRFAAIDWLRADLIRCLPHLLLLVAVSPAPGPDACAALLQTCELALAPGTRGYSLWAAHILGAIRGGVARADGANDDAHRQNCTDSDPTEHDSPPLLASACFCGHMRICWA